MLRLLMISALAAVTLSSCAYYNTFYSARRYYQQAMRLTKQQTGKTAIGIPPQASSMLDRAVEKCAKVISFYPKSKWVDDAVFLMGECYYRKQDYDRALRKFTELSMYYPKSPLVPKAVFMSGMCHFGQKDYEQASQVLRKVLQERPKLDARDRQTGQFTVGEALRQKKKYREALPYYRLLAGKTKSDLYFKSLLAVGECYFELALYDSAAMSFSAVVEGSSDDEQVLDALIRIGDSSVTRRDFSGALTSYNRALGLAGDFGKAPVVGLKIADVTAATGDYEPAIEVYRSVAQDFPRTAYASEAQFRIGYIYEVYLEDFESAGLAYDKVKEHSAKSEFTSQAELRSKGLAKLKEFKQAAETSEGDEAAESAFLMAELSLFQLGKPDKAIETYLGVEKEFPNSRYAAKSLYAVAYVFLNIKHDTLSATETYRAVVERFPSTQYAEEASEILRVLQVTPPEPLGEEPAEPERKDVEPEGGSPDQVENSQTTEQD